MLKNNILKIGVLLAILGFNNFAIAKEFSWINTRIPYNTTAKELAEKYYGDASDYKIIIEANKGVISKNGFVPKHTEIKIPVTEKFQDQPEVLGWN